MPPTKRASRTQIYTHVLNRVGLQSKVRSAKRFTWKMGNNAPRSLSKPGNDIARQDIQLSVHLIQGDQRVEHKVSDANLDERL